MEREIVIGGMGEIYLSRCLSVSRDPLRLFVWILGGKNEQEIDKRVGSRTKKKADRWVGECKTNETESVFLVRRK